MQRHRGNPFLIFAGLAFLLAFSIQGQAQDIDYWEPNDHLAQARLLAVPLPPPHYDPYAMARMGSFEDVDWFLVPPLPPYTPMWLSVWTRPRYLSGPDTALTVSNASQETVAFNDNISADILQSGIAGLPIQATEPPFVSVANSVQTQKTPKSRDDTYELVTIRAPFDGLVQESEPNNAAHNSQFIEPLESVRGSLSNLEDEDWYKITMDSEKQYDFNVALRNLSSDGDFEVALFDVDFTTGLLPFIQRGGKGQNDYASIPMIRLISNTFLIRVTSNYGMGDYHLFIGAGKEAEPLPDIPTMRCDFPALALIDAQSLDSPAVTRAMLQVESEMTISDLNVYLDIAHERIHDLKITLTNQTSGKSADLYNRNCDAESSNLIALFDEEGGDLSCPLSAGEAVRPTTGEPLSVFDGDRFEGTWLLTITDYAPEVSGLLNEWCLMIDGFEMQPTPTLTSTPAPTATKMPTQTQTSLPTATHSPTQTGLPALTSTATQTSTEPPAPSMTMTPTPTEMGYAATLIRRLIGHEIFSSIAVAELDGDAGPEIVFGTDKTGSNDQGMGIYALNLDGSDVAGNWPVIRNVDVRSSPAAADIDHDNLDEVIIGTYGSPGSILILDHNGAILHNVKTQYSVMSSPAIADLDNDENYEIIVGTSEGKLEVLTAAGQPWSSAWPILLPRRDPPLQKYNDVDASPAIGDLDVDGFPDIAVISDDGVLYAYNRFGQPLEGFPFIPARATFPTNPMDMNGAANFSSPLILDLDGDGNLDVLCAMSNVRIYGMNGQGRMLPGFPIRLPLGSPTDTPAQPGDDILSTPAVGDIDGDGLLEMAVAFYGAEEGRSMLYAFDLTAPVETSAGRWRKFRGNPLHNARHEEWADGDSNRNGTLDSQDVLDLISAWKRVPAMPRYDDIKDAHRDGRIDEKDNLQIIQNMEQ